MDTQLLSQLSESLNDKVGQIPQIQVVSGFEAVVDEMVTVVGERQTPESFTPVPTIGDFGAWATECAGKSGLREAVQNEICAGGCTPNMGDGIASLGFPFHAFASVGEPAHPAFEPFVAKCQSVHTLGMEPGRVMCYEFQDGKLMLAFLSHFAKFTPDFLREQLADGVYLKACQQAQAICFTCWSLYPYMTDCWKYLQQEVLNGLTHRPHIYIDLADPASRSQEDIQAMLDSLQGFEAVGRVTLSLNGNEGNQVARQLGLEEAGSDADSLNRLAREIRERLQISELGIHLVKSATASTAEGETTVEGPYCDKPKKSVGAGDRYNAGYIAGLTLDLPVEQRLLLGTLSSGFFVREARSATAEELIQFIKTQN